MVFFSSSRCSTCSRHRVVRPLFDPDPVYAFLTLPIFASLAADLTRFFERTSKLQFALMVCVY